jgi:hypothetical protein
VFSEPGMDHTKPSGPSQQAETEDHGPRLSGDDGGDGIGSGAYWSRIRCNGSHLG